MSALWDAEREGGPAGLEAACKEYNDSMIQQVRVGWAVGRYIYTARNMLYTYMLHPNTSFFNSKMTA